MNNYPNWFLPLLIVSFLILLLTGLLLIPNALEMKFDYELLWHLKSGLRLLVNTTHTLFSYILIMLVGGLLVIHMPRGLDKGGDNAKSGIVLLCLFFILTLTGVGLFYGSNPTLILTSSASHILSGCLLVLLFLIHYGQKRINNRADIEIS